MFATDDLLVGVDIHRRTNVVQVMDGAGEIMTGPQRVANNRTGCPSSVSWSNHQNWLVGRYRCTLSTPK
jgi:hypothetical protein